MSVSIVSAHADAPQISSDFRRPRCRRLRLGLRSMPALHDLIDLKRYPLIALPLLVVPSCKPFDASSKFTAARFCPGFLKAVGIGCGHRRMQTRACCRNGLFACATTTLHVSR